MANEMRTPVSEWLQGQFETWRRQGGLKKTLTEFCAYTGIAEDKMLAYLNGSQIPRGDTLARLGAAVGFEIYTLVGIDPAIILDSLPHLFKLRLASAFSEYYDEINAVGVEPCTPEARAVFKEIAIKYKLTDIYKANT
jgi:transcriptional regulator with XRE-family HTH domain